MRISLIILNLLLSLFGQLAFAQTWTKISNIADTIKVKAVAQINNKILISGQEWGGIVVRHFTSTDGYTWSKLPTFSFAGDYLFGLKENNLLLGGSFLDCKKLDGRTWTTSFPGSGFAEFPNGTIIGGSGNFPDDVFQYSASGVRGSRLGTFKFKFGPKYGLGSNGRLFLFSYGSGFAYIDQTDLSKINFPATLNGAAMTESSWLLYSIDDMVKTSNGTLIATDKLGYGIIRSTDNGVNWTTIVKESGASATSIAINSKDEIFVLYGGRIRKSSDLGLTYPLISDGLPVNGFQSELFVNASDELFVICNANGGVTPANSGIYKYGWPTGLGDNFDSGNTTFSIYPNPASNNTKIQMKGSFETAELTISNDLGVLVKFQILNSDKTLDINELPKGLYIVKLVIDGQSNIQKLIMQ